MVPNFLYLQPQQQMVKTMRKIHGSRGRRSSSVHRRLSASSLLIIFPVLWSARDSFAFPFVAPNTIGRRRSSTNQLRTTSELLVRSTCVTFRRTTAKTTTLLYASNSPNNNDRNSSSNSNSGGTSDWKDTSSLDANQWRSIDEEQFGPPQTDWQDLMKQKQDGTFWSTFEPSATDDNNDTYGSNPAAAATTSSRTTSEELDAEAWLDTIASLSADEVEFNLKEADRADKVRQMQEWGFTNKAIASTLGVATDLTLEVQDDVQDKMQLFREGSYLEDVDLETVESHTMVEIDEDTGEPIRNRMVYVDEHTCIGCTNCAMIAQSTFFMHSEHGRARVFNQWGDSDETIQVAIETCPVDCIHYVPYDELVKLEIERRGQNINFKARLVSQAEYGGTGLAYRVGGPNAFTAPQKISGNMGSRCNNCPTRGCANCPMYGVGQNPEYQRKEQLRKERMAKRKLQQQREKEQKSAEL